MKLKSIKQSIDERRFHIEGLGEVDLCASVWEDLSAGLVRGTVEKLRVGQSEELRFTGSFNLGKVRVRRVQ